MTHHMPGAIWRPISRNYTQRRRARTRGIVNHVDAGNAPTLYHWFNDPRARASSHLFVKLDGTIEQYIDLDLTAWAQNAGDAELLSVETQGYGNGQWTKAQIASLIRIWIYCAKHYGFPLRAMSSSRASESGIGWHALGVPATYQQKADRLSQTGGQLWSSAVGKICPGPGRIKQIPAMISQARELATPAAPPPSKGTKMLMIALPKGRNGRTLFAVFGPGFWLEFTGQKMANTFIRQIGAIPAKAGIVDRAFWEHCKRAATKGSNA